jgi:glycerol-3-phosphate dehydrogenase (NAD(P)+)
LVNATVLGAGSWGTALSLVLADKGHNVKLWGRNKDALQLIKQDRENIKYLPGIKLPENIIIEHNLEKALYLSELVVLSVPSQSVRGICQQISKYINKKTIIVNTAKGIEIETLSRLSLIIINELKIKETNFTVLSGPTHAEEVARKQPTAIVAASVEKNTAEFVQDTFMTNYFRVYTNPDVIGVETGGAFKNVIALATGICDGLGFGDNSKAALMTRGLTEIGRLGCKLGGDPLTFAGLSGVGDLIVTCTSMHSRNRRAGIQIGKGKSLEQILKEMGMVVEGIKTTEAAYKIANNLGIEVPITNQLYEILFNNLDPKKGVENLMERNKTHEVEEIGFKSKAW